MTAERRTLDHVLVEEGREDLRAYQFTCPCCGYKFPPIQLPLVDEADEKPGQPPKWESGSGFVCSSCYLDYQRDTQVSTAATALPGPQGWDSSAGISLRAERDALIEKWAWTLRDETPLDRSSRKAFGDYLYALHRMTVTAASPEAWRFPAVPKQTFMSALEYRTRLALKTE